MGVLGVSSGSWGNPMMSLGILGVALQGLRASLDGPWGVLVASLGGPVAWGFPAGPAGPWGIPEWSQGVPGASIGGSEAPAGVSVCTCCFFGILFLMKVFVAPCGHEHH